MTETPDFTETIEHLEKTAQALGLPQDAEKYAFFQEMIGHREFGLAFDTIEDFVGEQEGEDMVAVSFSLARLRSLLELPRR